MTSSSNNVFVKEQSDQSPIISKLSMFLYLKVGPYFLIGILFLSWEAIARMHLIDPFLLPALSKVSI